jgi:phage recombination protein Bet
MSQEIAISNTKELETSEKLGIDLDIYRALKYSLFPEASDISIGMYLAYCRAKNYDPLKKPMHIVPIGCKTGKKNPDGKEIYETRDVIMPGIISYRIDAVRTGTFYGISDAEFGPMITKTLGKSNLKFEFPEWCRLVIYKKIGDEIREIPAKLYFMECYSTASAFTDEPNRMWKKRPRAMLEKCCESLAYRKGFPEETGGMPTMDEMEGRQTMDDLPGEKDITEESKKIESTPLSQTFKMDEELLQAQLNTINNCGEKKLLQEYYKEAKQLAKGDKIASNKISIATKERLDYLKQLPEEKPIETPPSNETTEEFYAAYNSDEKNE